MPEYDAFGRPVGEDPLAGLGWTSAAEGERRRAPDPERPADPAPAAPPAAPAPPAPGRPRPKGILGRWIVALAILGAVGLALVSAVSSGTKAVRGAVDDGRVTLPTAEPGTGRAPRKAVPLTTPRGLRAGLRTLAADVPGRLQSLRLEDGRIDVTVWLKGGRLRSAQLQAGAEAAQVFSTTGGGFPATGLFPYEAVNPRAPAHLIRAADRRLGRRASQVNYLVLMRFAGTLTWGVYYKDGAAAQGDARGRYTRRIS